MDNKKTMDLGAIKNKVAYANGSGEKVRSLANAKNLTAEHDLNEFIPAGNRVMISIKAWPSQSQGGIFVPDSYTIIRGEKYITKVEDVGEDVTLIKKGDIAIISMYSGHHITTKTGHAKLITETDIFAYKKEENMESTLAYHPKTFKPGINYILVEVNIKKEVILESGLITNVGDDSAFSKNDEVTKTGKVLAIGEVDKYGKAYKNVAVGTSVVFDAYVGMPLNATTTEDEGKYLIMFAADVLATLDIK